MKNLLKNTAIILLIVLQSCDNKEDNAKKPEAALNVKTQSLTTERSYKTLSYSGQMISEEKSTLSFLVGGMIHKMYVDEGDYVKKGTLLATLNSTDYKNELQLREAHLLEAKDTYQRMEELYDKQSIPERDYIRAKAGFLSADAMVKIARKKLADTFLYAPYDGTIYKKMHQVGTVVNLGQPIYEIANLSELEIAFSVPEDEINTLKIGDKVEANLTSLNNKKVFAKITSIVTVANAITRSYKVKAIIDNKEGIFKDGMLLTINVVTTEKEQQIKVPGSAIVVSAKNVPHIFILDQSTKRALKKRVKIGGASGTSVQILEGLTGNETIIVEGQHHLKDGSKVNGRYLATAQNTAKNE